MGAYYGKKIQKGEKNKNTGKAWTIDDVPTYWVAKTKAYLGIE